MDAGFFPSPFCVLEGSSRVSSGLGALECAHGWGSCHRASMPQL